MSEAHEMRKSGEQGAIAVEMALLAPILVALVLGIVEFGFAFNAQTTITHSAREAVREMAINDIKAEAQQTAVDTAAPMVTLSPGQVNVVPGTCNSGDITVTIEYTHSSVTGFIPDLALTGKGVMRCGG